MIGQTINNRYRIEASLGRGGMGTVYRASDLVESRAVALKVLHLFLDQEGEATLTRFHREFRVLARLNHPYIMQAYDYGTFEETPYLVLELLEGVTLRQELTGEPLPRERLLPIARQLAEALVYLHTQSIIHRDLKPGNLMLLPPHDSPQVKLMDFGLVRQTDMSMQLTQEGLALGTVAYMAPEQAQALPVDFRADLYALGIILYEMAAGRPPFTHHHPAMVLMQQMTTPPPPPRQFNPTLDEPLEQFILTLLAKEPAERPASTDLVVQQLAYLADESVMIVSPTGPDPAIGRADLIPRVPLIGRAAALADLTQNWVKAKTGQGQIILLSGGAGLGKTRLLTEMGLQVKMDGGKTLTCHCREHTSLPYQPVIDILDMALRHLPAAERETIPPELARLLPGAGVESPNEPAPTDQAEARLRLFAACWDLLNRAAQTRPLLIAVEDVQWVDPSTLELLAYLAQRMPQAPVLLVLSLRPEEVDAKVPVAALWHDWQRGEIAQAIMLEPLTPGQIADFLKTALGQKSLPQWIIDNFQQATGGNPLFIEETLKALAAEGQVGEWIGPKMSQLNNLSGMMLQLPQNVLDLAERRLQLLTEEDRSILTAAAVLGPEFPFALLEAVTQMDEDDLLDAIDRLLASRLIEELPLQEGEDRYRFAQEALRQALLKTISQRRLRVMHRRSGEAIQAIYDTRQQRYWPVLAHHFAMSGNDQSAQKYFTLAGQAAARVYAHAEAISYYGRALDMAKRDTTPHNAETNQEMAHLYIQLGRALELNSQFDQALAIYEEMAEVAHQRDAPAMKLTALMARATLQAMPSPVLNPVQGEVISKQALVLAHDLGDQTAEAKTLWNLSNLCKFSNRLPQAIDYGERALTLARDLNQTEQIAFILNDLALCYWFAGRLNRAGALFREADDLWRDLNNLPMLVDSLTGLAGLAVFGGDYDLALTFSEEAAQISQSIGNLWGQSYSKVGIGYVYWDRGQPGQAIAVMEECLRLSDLANYVVPQVYTRADLAAVYGSLGAFECGLETARQALTVAETKMPGRRPYALARLAQLHLKQGDLTEAARAIDRAKTDPNREAAPTFFQLVYLAEAELALGQGAYERALDVTNVLLANLQHFNMQSYMPHGLYLQGQALLGLGQVEPARNTLLAARIKAEAIGSRRTLWPILATLADLETDLLKAEPLRQQAREIITYIADHALPELRASFLELPTTQELLTL
ncbi:MAG TPA: protein kinase [Anaerolineae bacterium]|nr:protein kinase [Anaerolineae bacterium]